MRNPFNIQYSEEDREKAKQQREIESGAAPAV
jgi:hypothetical protein